MTAADANGLPAGRVTMLFSDIEGSTAFAHRFGAAWPAVLDMHRRAIRACIHEHRGREVGTEGDSFFVVFPSASDGLACALDAQASLARQPWPEGAALRVRMGLHTGEPTAHDGDYVGIDVHLAARVMSAGHGGQIVLTDAVAGALEGGMREDRLRDLGWHRLKDFDEPQHLYQAGPAGRSTEFPPLRSLGRSITLPAFRTPLIGRDRAIEDIQTRIATQVVRLITLTGPGGSGKTRLAVAVAASLATRFAGGVYFAGLDSVQRADDLWSVLSTTLGMTGDAESSSKERVIDYLRHRACLLVLDNLEQIRDVQRPIEELLDRCSGVTVVATSRGPLDVVGEHVYPVPPLPVARSSDADAPSAAVALFVQHARMARPQFVLDDSNRADVESLCRHLDGLPLAIELVASRIGLLSPAALLARLDRLDGARTATHRPERQRSLTATVAWSYDLLDAPERRAFASLAVFESHVELEAFSAVAAFESDTALDTIARLQSASLVQVVDGSDGEPQVRLLETIRAYALARLRADGDEHAVRLRHGVWCAEAVEQVRPLLSTARHAAGLDRISRIERDVLGALDWALRAAPSGEQADGESRTKLAQRLLEPMNMVWNRYSRAAQGKALQERAVAVIADRDSVAAVDALHGLGVSQLQQGDLAGGTRQLELALAMTCRIGDRSREARELNSLGIAMTEAGNAQLALEHLHQSASIACELGNENRLSAALTNIVVALTEAQRYDEAIDAARRAVEASERLGDPWVIAIDRLNFAAALMLAGHVVESQAALGEHAAAALQMADPDLSASVVELFACCRECLGDPSSAATLLACAVAQRRTAGIAPKPQDQRTYDRYLREAQGSLNWADAREHGASLTFEQALAFAMSRIGDDVAAHDADTPRT